MTIQPGSGYTFTSSSLGTNLTIEKEWSPIYIDSSGCYPFRINLAGKDEDDDYLFECCPATVNSLIPQIGITADADKRLDEIPRPTTKLNFSESGYSYIHLKVSQLTVDDVVQFPVTDETDILYPRVISNSIQQAPTFDSVFYLIATIYKDPETDKITINQLSNGSLWCDRILVGSSESGAPSYFFARS